MAFHDLTLLIASPLVVLCYTLSGELLREIHCLVNVRCLCYGWVGTIVVLYNREPWLDVAGDGEVSCALAAEGRLWVAENTSRVICCYRTDAALPFSQWQGGEPNFKVKNDGLSQSEPCKVNPRLERPQRRAQSADVSRPPKVLPKRTANVTWRQLNLPPPSSLAVRPRSPSDFQPTVTASPLQSQGRAKLTRSVSAPELVSLGAKLSIALARQLSW